MIEDLGALGAGPGHLEVQARHSRGADVLQVEFASLGGYAHIEGGAGLVGGTGDLEGVVGPGVRHAESEGGRLFPRAGIAQLGGVGFDLLLLVAIHFLLAGREPWRGVRPAAIATAVCWVGLGVFAAFYFSTTIVDDSKTYGTIGVTFTLVTWFIAMGAVLTLGAVVGAVWQKRRGGNSNPQPFETTTPSE